MHDHFYLCLQIRNNHSYFHHQCSLHRRQEFRLLPETSRQGPVHKAMETSSGSCKPVLDPLEPRILTLLATKTKVDSTSQKPSSGRSSSAQGQADSPQLLAHGQNLCRIPWKGWACKKGLRSQQLTKAILKPF